MPPTLVKDLVAYAVSRINIRRTTAINLNVCPRVLFTGMRINYKKELELAFGDYVEVYDGTENTSKSRSIPCIALYPCCNATGSWEFMSLKMKTRVRRSQWNLMVTTQAIIDTMNTFDDAPVAIVAEPAANVDVSEPVQETSTVPDVPVPVETDTAVPEPVGDTSGTGNAGDDSNTAESGQREESAAIIQEEEEDPEMPGLMDPEDDASDNEAEEEEEENRPRRSARIASGILKPSRYTMATKIIKQQSNSEERNTAIEKAESEEIELLFVGLRALQPVLPQELGDTKPFRCHMFTVEKFLADGSFDKVKTRMVANGDEQDPQLYPDRSSPTVALHSIFACLAVAAYTRQYTVAKIDVKGAFIQTEMEDPPVFIRCDKKLTWLIVKLLPGIKK